MIEIGGDQEIVGFVALSSMSGMWRPLSYYRRKIGTDEPFYLGLEQCPISRSVLLGRINTCLLPTPHPLPSDLKKGLWLDDEQTVWLADQDDPTHDPGKIRLCSIKDCRWPGQK